LRFLASIRANVSAKILLVTLVSVMAAMSVAELFLYRSDRVEAVHQLEDRAQVAAVRLAHTLADPVAAGDATRIKQAISHEMKSREVLAIVVENPAGRPVAGTALHDACSTALLDPCAVDERLLRGARVKASSPIIREGAVFGSVSVHFSDVQLREAMNHRAIEGIQHTFLLTLVFSAVLWLSLDRIVVRPLKTLEASVARVARGDFEVAIPAASGDEMGRVGASFNRMVADLRRLYTEARANEARFRKLSDWQREAIEGERKRIAREIHDDLGGRLTALRLDLHWVGKRLLPEQAELADKVRALTASVDRTHDAVEHVIRQLRPQVLDDLGLVAAVEWLALEFEKRSGVPVEFSSAPETVSPSPDRATALFRIAQEALTNVARHADAALVRIRIREIRGVLAMSIRDDGKGFDPAKRAGETSHGLMGIAERARIAGGRLKVRSAPGEGTELTVLVPAEGNDPGGTP
jgi:signal transduction histidine kinase